MSEPSRSTYFPERSLMALLGRKRPLVMGVINRTPDSFYPGSRIASAEEAADQAERMVGAGADILDLGGESSRPGSAYLDEDAERERVVPAIAEIRKRLPRVLISVDTRKAGVAGPALDAGADIVNDISALRDDPDLVRLSAERNVPVVLMHMRGTPITMQDDPVYADAPAEVRSELLESARRAEASGIRRENIVLDPGIGFGKRLEHNLAILGRLSLLVETGYPVLVGLSRKGFLGRLLDGRPAEGRLAGTLAALAWCVLEGAAILRVHDVEETSDLCRVLDAIRTA